MNADVLNLLRQYPRLTLDQVDVLLGTEPPPEDGDQGDGDQGDDGDQGETGATVAPLLLALALGFLATRRRK